MKHFKRPMIGIILFILIIITFAVLFPEHQYSLLLWLSLVLMIPITIIIHELGHVISGYLVNYTFYFLIIGPIKIEKNSKGKLALKENKSWLYIGLSALFPNKWENEKSFRKKWLLYISGGILANFFSFIIFLLIYLISDYWLFILYSLANLLGVIINLIPLQSASTFSDGLAFFKSISKGIEGRLYLFYVYLSGAFLFAGHPAEMNPKDIQKAEELIKNHPIEQLNLYIGSTLIYHYLLSGKWIEGYKILSPIAAHHQSKSINFSANYALLALLSRLNNDIGYLLPPPPRNDSLSSAKIKAVTYALQGEKTFGIAVLDYEINKQEIKDKILFDEHYETELLKLIKKELFDA